MNDPDILTLYRSRNEDAIRITDEKYRSLCKSIAKNVLGSEEDACECVNDALLALWNSIPPTEPTSLLAYLCATVRNLALKRLDYLSAAKRSRAATVPFEDLEEILSEEGFDSLEAKELGNLLNQFLKSEAADPRRVFLRRYYFCDSIADIAARFRFSESKVKSMLYHSRKRLRAFLAASGIQI